MVEYCSLGAKMANKTQENDRNVAGFLDGMENTLRREDTRAIYEMMARL